MISVNKPGRLRFAVLGIAAVVALALLMPACGGGGTRETAGTEGGTTAAPATDNAGQMVSIQALTSNPQAYYNRQVAVTGVVRQIVGPGAFVIGQTPNSPQNETILVAGSNLPDLRVGEPVSIVGTPQQFDFNTFNNQVGQNWNQAAFTPYMNQPAIMATEVTSHGNMQGNQGQYGGQQGQPQGGQGQYGGGQGQPGGRNPNQ